MAKKGAGIPYEITEPFGSVEHMNEESGIAWMQRLTDQWQKMVWLNPVPEAYWSYTHSTQMLQKMVNQQMFPLSLNGLQDAIDVLAK